MGPQSSKEKYPQIYYLCCCKAIILSQQHVALMLLFFLGFISIGLNVAYLVIAVANNHNENDAGHPYTGVSFFTFIVLQLVVFLLLVKFEEIDVVQRLEKEVQELKAQKMKEFWGNAQNLTELWLYRTVPRLDLYKEIHSQLEDSVSKEELLSNMSSANKALKALENNLGNLQAWRNDGDLNQEDKKAFGRNINELCQFDELNEMLVQLADDMGESSVMQKLRDLPQAPQAPQAPQQFSTDPGAKSFDIGSLGSNPAPTQWAVWCRK